MRPLALGWAVLMTRWSTPNSRKYLSKCPINSLPLSDLTTSGTPYRVVILLWNSARMVELLILWVGQASTHLLLTQTQVTNRVWPEEPGINGPTQSMHHTAKGGTVLWVGIRCGGGGNFAYSNYEESYCAHSAMQSRGIPFQYHSPRSNSYSR